MVVPRPCTRPSRTRSEIVNNNVIVESLRSALLGGQRAERRVPGLVEEVIDEEAWVDRGWHAYVFVSMYSAFDSCPKPMLTKT
jgi:hypothetical protein